MTSGEKATATIFLVVGIFYGSLGGLTFGAKQHGACDGKFLQRTLV